MLPSTTSSTSQELFFQSLFGNTYPRRLLLYPPLYKQPAPHAGENPNSAMSNSPESEFDANVVMILAVLLCALICALGLNSVVRCALRCSGHMTLFASADAGSARVANTGVKRKALGAFPILPYSAGLKLPGSNTDCAICISEFVTGERVRILPKCNHGFHVKCIDRWLMAHSSCPTCRQCLFNMCQKTSRCSEASPTGPAEPPASVIVPLEPEGLVTGYRHGQ